MQRDPDKVVDATKDRATDWQEKVKSGELVRTSGFAKNNVNQPGFLHIQGRPVSEEQAQSRIVPAAIMAHVVKTGYYPEKRDGHSKYFGGLDFDAEGNIKRED